MLLTIKSVTLAFTWLVAFFAGRLPIRQQNHTSFIRTEKLNHFIDGIFLGIALCHLIPEAIEGFSTHYTSTYAVILATSWCAGIFGLLQSLIWAHSKWHIGTRESICYFIVTFVGLHAFTEGFILGMVNHTSQLLMLCFALLIHKGAESYAVIHSLIRQGVNNRLTHIMLIVFASLTPLGGITFLIGHHWFLSSLSGTLEATLNAIAAGTFIFLAFACQTCLPQDPCSHQASSKSRSTHYLLLGFLLMFVISQLGHEHHGPDNHAHHHHHGTEHLA